MNKKQLVLISLAIAGMFSVPFVFSSSDSGAGYWDRYRQKSIGVASIKNKDYLEECGSCHMAYQPGLLVSQSWQQIMHSLADHFGDNAELDNETRQQLEKYLLANSAEKSDYRRAKKFSTGINSKHAPTRITKTPYFIHKHDEIPVKIVTSNKKVGSFSHCNACHTEAEKGIYDEDGVQIPGYGRWED